MVDTVKAPAIFWIDKAEAKHCKDSGLRTIKAKVFIHENGKVDFLSFTKKQSSGVEKYIHHHLHKFKNKKLIYKGGYILTGEQFVQLRCMREKLQAMQ